MNPDTSSSNRKRPSEHHFLSWILLPLSLFPFVALLTYDWHAIEALQCPPVASTNWIGYVGDTFAYYGYMFFGLAIWVVPVVCFAAGLLHVLGKHLHSGARKLYLILFLLAASCLMQVLQLCAPGVSSLLAYWNVANAGGVAGYLIMTRLLIPLISAFGASVLMLAVLLLSGVLAVGPRNILAFFAALGRWAAAGRSAPEEEDEKPLEPMPPHVDEPKGPSLMERIKAAREAAKAEREAAKAAARAEKEAAASAAAPVAEDRAPVPHPAPRPAHRAPEAEEPLDKGPYVLPPLSLLNPVNHTRAEHGDVNEMSARLINTLKIFGIDASLSYTVQGPVVTKYAVELAPGTRYSSVTSISDNLMGALHAKSLRIEAPIPGEDRVGIEVPNVKPVGISFAEIFTGEAWRSCKYELPLLFGKDAAGKDLIADLATMPHMLVAGATGQGKSVCLNAIINGLLMTRTPEQLKLIMVDPKSVEFTSYASIPHLLVPVITDNRKVVYSLAWAVSEMEKRLKLFARARVRNIFDFNHRPLVTQPDMFGGEETSAAGDMPRTVPYIVIIIDEVADLMASSAKEVTPNIARLTAKARAAGIHLILATQRPDAKVITGTIKANIPGRVAFKTATGIDSRTILDEGGAENLIGKGDMLFRTKDGMLIRAQGAWISDPEIARITEFIEKHSNVQFDKTFATKLGRVKEAGIEDPFASNEDDPDNHPAPEAHESAREAAKLSADADNYQKAIEVIIRTKRASVSHFQRQLGIGYNNAARLCDRLEQAGIIAPQQAGAGPRQILMDPDQLNALLTQGAGNGDEGASSKEQGASVEQGAGVEEKSEPENGSGFYVANDLFDAQEDK